INQRRAAEKVTLRQLIGNEYSPDEARAKDGKWTSGGGGGEDSDSGQVKLFTRLRACASDAGQFANVLTGGGTFMENGPIAGLAKVGRVGLKVGVKVAGVALNLLVSGFAAMAHSFNEEGGASHTIYFPKATYNSSADGMALIQQALDLCDT